MLQGTAGIEYILITLNESELASFVQQQSDCQWIDT